MLGVAVACLLLPLVTTAAGLAAILVLISFANGLGSGIVMTIGADTAPEAGRAQYLGGWRLCGDIGNTGGPLLVGLVSLVAPLATACVVVGTLGSGGCRVGGLLDPAAGPRPGPQPIAMTTSLEVAPVSVSAIRNRVSPPWPVWM